MVISCETEAGDGSIVSGALYVSDFDFLIFWLENLYVQDPSYFLSKTPPSFAAVCQWSQISPERAFCAILE